MIATIINKAIVQGIPLLFGSTGEIITEKSGNLNLGIPGIMYMGGSAGVIGAYIYEQSTATPSPFWCIVIPLLSAEAQHKCGGFDHAGKFESSLMYALYPDHVDLEGTKQNTEWFALNSAETSMELGQHMVQCALEALDKMIA